MPLSVTNLIQRSELPDPPTVPGASMLPGGSSRFSHGTFGGRVAVLISGIGVLLIGAHALSIPTPPCPLRSTTGFPCPFCGLTHLGRELTTGQVGLVAHHDPAGLILAVLLFSAVAAQVVAMIRRRPGPTFMTWRIAGIAVATVLAAHWVTTIITGGLLTA